MSLRDGHTFALSLELIEQIIELDAFIVVSYLKNEFIVHPSLSPLASDCKLALVKDPSHGDLTCVLGSK